MGVNKTCRQEKIFIYMLSQSLAGNAISDDQHDKKSQLYFRRNRIEGNRKVARVKDKPEPAFEIAGPAGV